MQSFKTSASLGYLPSTFNLLAVCMKPDFLKKILNSQIFSQKILNTWEVIEAQNYGIITLPRHKKVLSVIFHFTKQRVKKASVERRWTKLLLDFASFFVAVFIYFSFQTSYLGKLHLWCLVIIFCMIFKLQPVTSSPY